ncbi:hypothetical protein AB0M46_01835 [Dactylosporangium sp. NPDC051485]
MNCYQTSRGRAAPVAVLGSLRVPVEGDSALTILVQSGLDLCAGALDESA